VLLSNRGRDLVSEPNSRGVFDTPEAADAMGAYGRAIVAAQALEILLATVLGTFRRVSDPSLTREEWVALTERLEAQTLGRLKELFRDLGAPEAQVKQIEAALKLRNFLIHDCFREPDRIDLMTSLQGRLGLEAEFKRAKNDFDDCFKLMAAILLKVVFEAGFDSAGVIKRAESLLEREPRDAWERRVKIIASDPERRREIEKQLAALGKLRTKG